MPFGNHTLLLSLEGALLAFGYNSKGQLGLGHNNDQLTPATVPWKGPQPVQVDWGYTPSPLMRRAVCGRPVTTASLLLLSPSNESQKYLP